MICIGARSRNSGVVCCYAEFTRFGRDVASSGAFFFALTYTLSSSSRDCSFVALNCYVLIWPRCGVCNMHDMTLHINQPQRPRNLKPRGVCDASVESCLAIQGSHASVVSYDADSYWHWQRIQRVCGLDIDATKRAPFHISNAALSPQVTLCLASPMASTRNWPHQFLYTPHSDLNNQDGTGLGSIRSQGMIDWFQS